MISAWSSFFLVDARERLVQLRAVLLGEVLLQAGGISRARGRSGFRRLLELEPGSWFRCVPPETYLCRYAEILARLDPVAQFLR